MPSKRNSTSQTSRNGVAINVMLPLATRARLWAQRMVPVCAALGAIGSGAFTLKAAWPTYRGGQLSGAGLAGAVTGSAAAGAVAGGVAAYGGALVYGSVGGTAGVVTGVGVALVAGTAVRSTPALLSGGFQVMKQNRAEEKALMDPTRLTRTPLIARTIAAYGDTMYSDATGGELTDRERKREQYKFDAPPFKGPWNDEVLYIGMNRSASPRAVRRLRGQGAKVTLITNGDKQDFVNFNGRLYDLRSAAGIANFATALKLPATQTQGLQAAFKACEKDARDELGQIAVAWLRAERKGVIPSRLVLAGHSNGDGVWGDNNGSLRLGPLRLLAQAMPRAARQIEDAFVAGCYSGGEVTMEQYGLIMPQVKSIWAYEVQAPGVDNGGAVDQAGWELATRGRNADTMPAKHSIVRKHMAVWNSVRGYIAMKPPLTMNQLRGKVEWMQKKYFTAAFSGQTSAVIDNYRIPIGLTDPQTGLVRQYYSWLCRLTQDPDLPEGERENWVRRKHQTIRLIYYTATVAPRFANYYARDIKKGYADMGLQAPNYAHLTRGQALASIRSFQQKVKATKKPSADATRLAGLLQHGLHELDPDVIADGWV